MCAIFDLQKIFYTQEAGMFMVYLCRNGKHKKTFLLRHVNLHSIKH
jgi:hypothetical protein